jgi:hypothetical protein
MEKARFFALGKFDNKDLTKELIDFYQKFI